MTERTLPSAKESALQIAVSTARRARDENDAWTLRRNKAMALAYEQGASSREIGEVVGLSHQTVINAINSVRDRDRTGREDASTMTTPDEAHLGTSDDGEVDRRPLEQLERQVAELVIFKGMTTSGAASTLGVSRRVAITSIRSLVERLEGHL